MLVIEYQYDKNEGKEVRAMEGITKIDIPEIEGLRETFTESKVRCSAECDPDHKCG